MIDYIDDALRVRVMTPMELLEALDTLHTQVLDNLSEAISAPYLRILEKAMEDVDRVRLGGTLDPEEESRG